MKLAGVIVFDGAVVALRSQRARSGLYLMTLESVRQGFESSKTFFSGASFDGSDKNARRSDVVPVVVMMPRSAMSEIMGDRRDAVMSS